MKDQLLNLMNRDLEEYGLENDWHYNRYSNSVSLERLPNIPLA